MPWIVEADKEYWMPEVLPQPTEEYQQVQAEKRYLTTEGKERMHPGWTYAETIAYVDDEYLFQNEGWKVVIGETLVEPVLYGTKKHYIKNSPDQWIEIDERTIEATHTLIGWIPEEFPEPTLEYQQGQIEKKYLTSQNEEKRHPQWEYTETGAYVDDEYLFQNEGWKLVIDEEPSVKLKHNVRNSPEGWEEIDERNVKVTYTLVDFTVKEIEEYEEEKWKQLRDERDNLLQETDWIIVRAIEENLIVSSEVTVYRQELRNFPETIENILEFDIDDNTLWPTKPEVYFEVY
jgi:hypothetical protein